MKRLLPLTLTCRPTLHCVDDSPAPSTGPTEAATSPNIPLITADDLGLDDLAASGTWFMWLAYVAPHTPGGLHNHNLSGTRTDIFATVAQLTSAAFIATTDSLSFAERLAKPDAAGPEFNGIPNHGFNDAVAFPNDVSEQNDTKGVGDLDECNGITIDGACGDYITDGFPYIVGCYKGTPDSSFNKRQTS